MKCRFQDGVMDGEIHVTAETCTELGSNSSFFNVSDASSAFNATTDMCPESDVPHGYRMVAFIALVTFVCAYSFSFGPVTWVLLSEVFPAATKGRAMALATSLNWLGNSLVSATFLSATGEEKESFFI